MSTQHLPSTIDDVGLVFRMLRSSIPFHAPPPPEPNRHDRALKLCSVYARQGRSLASIRRMLAVAYLP